LGGGRSGQQSFRTAVTEESSIMSEPGAHEPTALDWSGPTAQFWADHDDRYDALLARPGATLLAAAAPSPGEQVLDVGCGCGSTTLPAARLVAPDGGRATGVDISRHMIDKARSRARESGVGNARFRVDDAQTADLGRAAFDLVISRFGVMFFADHLAAFVNLRAAARPGGRLAFVCWAERIHNEHWTLAFDALAPHLGLARPSNRPEGPFALADPVHLRALLTRAGWVDVEIDELREPLLAGRDADDAVEFELSDPETAQQLAAAGPDAAARARADLRAAFATLERTDGVWLAATAWLVRATRR
jgi:SAM-dependent methyltransferase